VHKSITITILTASDRINWREWATSSSADEEVRVDGRRSVMTPYWHHADAYVDSLEGFEGFH
jgi:hypothetical protein